MIIQRSIKQPLTKEEIELDVPAFFKDGYEYSGIYSEDMVIQIVDIPNYVSIRKSGFTQHDKDKVKLSNSISEEEFMDVFQKAVTYTSNSPFYKQF